MLKSIINKLDIDDEFTKKIPKQKKFNKVKNSIVPMKNYNFQSDLLFLPTSTKTKNKYCLVVLDLANNAFDIEGMKDKTAESTLKAFKEIIKRKYLDLPFMSIRTDNGTEFQGVFNKYLEDNAIYHSVAQPYRHKQLANINMLCRQLGLLFNLFMNAKERKLKRHYTNWDDKIDIVREELNKVRMIKTPEKNDFSWLEKINFVDKNYKKSKYKIGDIVYKALDYPKNALNHKVYGKFREGDIRWDETPRKIKHIIYMPDYPYIRYILDSLPNVSYFEGELKPSKEKEEKFVVERIIGEKTENKLRKLLIKWKGYKVNEATYEPYDTIKEDLGDIIFNELYQEFKKKKK
jgi:hypothetical protein